MERHSMASTSFPAMGVTVTISGVHVPTPEIARGARVARAMAADWEQRFSRFLPDSELRAVNAAAGQPVQVSTEFLELLEKALLGVHRSEGRFDPAVLPALEQAGYDRSFESIVPANLQHQIEQRAPDATGWHERTELDFQRSTVRLPNNVRIDFGGIAKGAFVDRVLEQLRHWPGGCVDAGGDLRVWGIPPNGLYWTVGIQDPRNPVDDLAIARIDDVDAQAVATSGTYKRRWTRNGVVAHHLIDPRSGSPVSGRVTAVTAFAGTAVDAEIESKSLLVAAGRGQPLALLAADLAVVCHEDGTYAVIETVGQRSAQIERNPARATA
jgi:thiamine biosynthesis lipoprotein